MPETWTRAAQELSPDDLPSYGRPTDEEAQAWMLDLLASEIEPRTHPARPAYFATNESWTTALAALEADGLITRPAASPQITDAGRAVAKRRRHDDITGPERLPFRVVVGPIASGNVVVKDAVTWEALAQMGMRTVKALEMEAAAVARVATDLAVPTWAVGWRERQRTLGRRGCRQARHLHPAQDARAARRDRQGAAAGRRRRLPPQLIGAAEATAQAAEPAGERT